jgi:ABC-type multidrug transport system fused ATPase/permease subunit
MLVIIMLNQGRAMASIVPVMGLFAAAAFRLLPSISRMLISMQALRYGIPAINHIHDDLKLAIPEVVENKEETAGDIFLQGEVELDNISYNYPATTASALVEVSMSIEKGESVGFIGPSGSGKSTLVDLILGLLTPDSGQVKVDGQNIQDNLRLWQDQIGYVPQAIFLTDDTLRRNIAFGLAEDQIDDSAVMRAIKAAQLEEFVAGLPDKLESMVGERGVRLSGGQRQRIGIARALYHDPGILVLDEATSSLDTETELEVMQTVTELHGSKTVIIVAHRLSTVENCDRLYRLDQGRLVEVGTPSTMIPATKVTSLK